MMNNFKSCRNKMITTVILIAGIAFSGLANAQTSVPNTLTEFVDGTPISAADVNANFQALKAGIDALTTENNARVAEIGVLTTANNARIAAIAAQDLKITTLTTANNARIAEIAAQDLKITTLTTANNTRIAEIGALTTENLARISEINALKAGTTPGSLTGLYELIVFGNGGTSGADLLRANIVFDGINSFTAQDTLNVSKGAGVSLEVNPNGAIDTGLSYTLTSSGILTMTFPGGSVEKYQMTPDLFMGVSGSFETPLIPGTDTGRLALSILVKKSP